MTMPSERTRALRFGDETLRDIAMHPQAQPEHRAAAHALLATYPSPGVVAKWIETDLQVLPAQAAQTLGQAGDLMRSVRRGGGCPEDLRRALDVTLRHFPDGWELERWSDPRRSEGLVGEWLLPEDYYSRS